MINFPVGETWLNINYIAKTVKYNFFLGRGWNWGQGEIRGRC
jgi:hypothetical protein